MLSKNIISKLYHYTSTQALIKILESNSLRLSNYSDLQGDNLELSLGCDELRKQLRKLDSRRKFFYRDTFSFVKLINDTQPKKFFVGCFCDSPNNMRLWQTEHASYETGVAIEFDVTELLELAISQGLFGLKIVDYNHQKMLEKIADAVASMERRLPRKIAFDHLRITDEIMESAVEATYTKHSDYAYQREIRLIVGKNDSFVDKYLYLSLQATSIKRIYVGRKNTNDLSLLGERGL